MIMRTLRSLVLATVLSPVVEESVPSDAGSKGGTMLRRVAKAAAATFSAQGITILSNLLLVPIFLRYWSPLVYGEWLALSSLATQLSMVDMGVSIFGVNKLTQTYARGDMREYRLYQSTFLAFYFIVASVGTLLTATMAWTLPLGDWLGLQATPAREWSWVIILLGVQVLWSIPQQFVVSIYRTTGNLAKTQWVMNTQRLLTLALAMLALVLGMGMVHLTIVQLIPGVVIVAWALQDIRRHLPELFPSLSGASFAIFRRMVKPSLLFAVTTLTTPLVFQGSTILVSVALGGVAVAMFATTRTLVNLVRQLIAAINYATWPELTMMEAQDQTKHLARMLCSTVILSIAISAALTAALWFEGDEILRMWTHGRLEPDLVLLHVFLIQTALIVVIQTAGAPATASNRHRNNAIAVLVASVLGIILAALLIKPLGLVGVPLGLLAGEAVAMYHFVVADACRISGIPYGPFARRLWLGVVVIGLATLGMGWLAHHYLSAMHYLVRWATVGLATSVTALLLGYVLVGFQSNVLFSKGGEGV